MSLFSSIAKAVTAPVQAAVTFAAHPSTTTLTAAVKAPLSTVSTVTKQLAPVRVARLGNEELSRLGDKVLKLDPFKNKGPSWAKRYRKHIAQNLAYGGIPLGGYVGGYRSSRREGLSTNDALGKEYRQAATGAIGAAVVYGGVTAAGAYGGGGSAAGAGAGAGGGGSAAGAAGGTTSLSSVLSTVNTGLGVVATGAGLVGAAKGGGGAPADAYGQPGVGDVTGAGDYYDGSEGDGGFLGLSSSDVQKAAPAVLALLLVAAGLVLYGVKQQ